MNKHNAFVAPVRLLGSSRQWSVDALHSEWRAAAENMRPMILARMRPLLLQQASGLCRCTLRQVNEALVEEVVDEILWRTIESFTGQNGSRFSTFTHSVFRFRFLTERTYIKNSLGEVPNEKLECADERYSSFKTEARVLCRQFLALGTKRERQVAELMLNGLKPDEIAANLHVSRRTVRCHISNWEAKCKHN